MVARQLIGNTINDERYGAQTVRIKTGFVCNISDLVLKITQKFVWHGHSRCACIRGNYALLAGTQIKRNSIVKHVFKLDRPERLIWDYIMPI